MADIAGATVCATAGTTTEKNIADAADAAGVEIQLATFEDLDIITDSFINGSCDLMTTDGSGLVGRKAKQEGDQEWVIFPAAPFSKEPLAPVYLPNQSTFGDIVNWTVYATIIFDEKGITSANVDDLLGSGQLDAEAVRLLGGEGELQSKMAWNPTRSTRWPARSGTTTRSTPATLSRSACSGPARRTRSGPRVG